MEQRTQRRDEEVRAIGSQGEREEEKGAEADERVSEEQRSRGEERNFTTYTAFKWSLREISRTHERQEGNERRRKEGEKVVSARDEEGARDGETGRDGGRERERSPGFVNSANFRGKSRREGEMLRS